MTYVDRRRLEGRHIVVTGAAGGIGSEVMRQARDLGADVTGIDLPDRADHPLWGELGASFIGLDLSGGGAEVAAALEPVGEVDGIVSVAAIEPGQPFRNLTDDVWDKCFAVNVRAPALLLHALRGRLRSPASVVNVTTLESVRVVFTGMETTFAYAAAKAALTHLTVTLAAEFGPAGIRLNAVAPGLIDSPMAHGMDKDARSWLIAQTPLGRDGRPSDIAAAVMFLLGDTSSHVTGQTIIVDGGLSSALVPPIGSPAA
jgi:NAD(P)-dependent dehydrogenase (short-subunit alcohol dehydrogenase family)